MTFQQEAFERETSILWNAATTSGKFVSKIVSKNIEDILDENRELKSQLEYFKGVLDGKITEILSSLQAHQSELQVHQSDINDFRIQQGHTSDEVASNVF